MQETRHVYPGQVYKHFKGDFYQVITVAHHSETGEILVVYQKLYGDYSVCARPYGMFLSEVDHKKYPDVEQVYRFELVKNFGDMMPEKYIRPDAKTYVKAPSNHEVHKETEIEDDKIEEDFFEETEPEGKIDKWLKAFLDAKTFREKEDVLIRFKNNKEITNRLIDDMAASIDVTVDDDDDVEKRYYSLRKCVETKRKYEIDRR